jgi:preprotein translocase subunit SecD
MLVMMPMLRVTAKPLIGPVKGFAVTLSIGILASMFTAVMLSRALANLIYGRQARLKGLSI